MHKAASATLGRRFCVAPMMDYTDRHCRYFLRLLSRSTHLYTEMIPTGAILRGDRERALAHHPAERPLALQLGGCEPSELAACARIAEDFGYDEINLNCGCPSDRVRDGRFGACLMREPELVSRCISAMRSATKLPITVKTRIGVDHQDSYEALAAFIETVAAGGCSTFILHARKAWLRGLSTKQNREIPPLRYATVYKLKQDFPQLEVIINGGIRDLDAAEEHLLHVDGVMLGRQAYHDPYLLATVDRRFYGATTTPPSRHDILAAFEPYVAAELEAGTPLPRMTRHLLGLFRGAAGARIWRRSLSEEARASNASYRLVYEAARDLVEDHTDPFGTSVPTAPVAQCSQSTVR